MDSIHMKVSQPVFDSIELTRDECVGPPYPMLAGILDSYRLPSVDAFRDAQGEVVEGFVLGLTHVERFALVGLDSVSHRGYFPALSVEKPSVSSIWNCPNGITDRPKL